MTATGMCIHDVRTAPRSPWQNAYVERFIGSVRRECLDHVIIFHAAGLRRVLRIYVAYYMTSRTHLALEKDAPRPRPVALTDCWARRGDPAGRRSPPSIRTTRGVNLAAGSIDTVETHRGQHIAPEHVAGDGWHAIVPPTHVTDPLIALNSQGAPVREWFPATPIKFSTGAACSTTKSDTVSNKCNCSKREPPSSVCNLSNHTRLSDFCVEVSGEPDDCP